MAARMNYAVGSPASATSPWMIDSISACEWYTKRDREEVCRLVYSDDDRKQRKAVARLAAWRARSHPRVPLGFEVTASLLVALMNANKKDDSTGLSESVVDDETVRLNLAMAIVRFVNLVTETGQVMYFSMDVSSIATKMGVPEWIVDIRHSCSHSMLPSMTVLVSAAKFALQWTKSHFWEADDPLDVQGALEEVSDERQQLVTREVVAQRLVNAQILRLGNQRLRIAFFQSDLDYLRQIETDELVDVLVEDGLLAPSRDKAFEEFFAVQEDDVTAIIIERLHDFWMPILNDLFERAGLFSAIVKALIVAATQTSTENRRTRMALEWLLVILAAAETITNTDDVGFLRDALLLVAPAAVNRNALKLLYRIKQMKLMLNRDIMSSGEPELTHRGADSSVWQPCSDRSWSNFAIGVNRDAGDEGSDDWFPDKLTLSCADWNNDAVML